MDSPALLVEAAGQLIHGFRHGLDYAFILVTRMRSVLFAIAAGES